MGFLKKLTAAIGQSDAAGQPDAEQLRDLRTERRFHARYPTADRSDFKLELPVGVNLVIKDISYGGLLTSCSSLEAHKITIDSFASARLKTPGKEFDVAIEQVRADLEGPNGAKFALRFDHKSVNALGALREVIEPIHKGSQIQPVDTANVKEEHIAMGWSYYRGDGPIDLSVRTFGEDVKDLILTLPMDGRYVEVRFKDDRLSTTIGEKAVHWNIGGIVQETSDPNVIILRSGYNILIGALPITGNAVQPIMDLIRDILSGVN